MDFFFVMTTLIITVYPIVCEVKNMEFTLRNKSDVIMLPLDEQHRAEGDLDCAIKCGMSQSDCDSFIYDEDSKACKLGYWILSKDAVITTIAPPSTSCKLFTKGKYCDSNDTVGYERMGSCQKSACLAQNAIVKKTSSVFYDPRKYRSCADVKNSTNPRQLLQLSSGLVVMCDTVTDGGGWTIFQRRASGVVDFYRNWEEYKHGFGDFDAGEFYLGNENIYCLTTNRSYEFRIDMTYNRTNYYAAYSGFKFYSESEFYKLYFDGYLGNAGNSINDKNNNQKFSTYDKDNDSSSRNCAVVYHGAWWYADCQNSNLNGLYGSTAYGVGLNWLALTGDYGSIERCEMKLRAK